MTGFPASNVQVTIERFDRGTWTVIAEGTSNDDGRIPFAAWRWHTTDQGSAIPGLDGGEYRATFATGSYFERNGVSSYFFPQVTVQFIVPEAEATAGRHFHIPLLLSPYGYSTYRGS